MNPANDPRLESWVPVAEGSDFPIQNLPFGIFKPPRAAPRAGCAIGDYIADLAFLHDAGFFTDLALPANVFSRPFLNEFLALGRKRIGEVRRRMSELLRRDNDTLQDLRPAFLFPASEMEMLMPVDVGDYTDFYSSEQHAFNVGSMFRGPEKALMPNWKHLPVAYHGRASTIVVSGTDVRRPCGQIVQGDDGPRLSASQKLDFELELAFISCGQNPLGEPIPLEMTDEYIAGFVLFNDWSARDIQQWEYVPLGPFLGKSFASTISPWLVTLDALEPFRVEGPTQDPPVLEYLVAKGARNFDIALEVFLRTEDGDSECIVRSNAKHLYWNAHQQLAHQTVNGCVVRPGDIYASGTISGPDPGSFGSLLELSWNGEKPLTLPGGNQRTFLEDGDEVIFRGYAEKNGVRIGFGACTGKVVPAVVPVYQKQQ